MSATQSERRFVPGNSLVVIRSALAMVLAAGVLLGCHDTPTTPAPQRLAASLKPAAAISAGSFAVRPLGTLGGDGGYAVGINASGDIVGTSYDSTYGPKPTLWPASSHLPQDLGSIWGNFVGPGAEAINTAGDIAGEADNGVGQGPTLWPADGGTAQNLGSLPGLQCWVHGIDDGGDVVGECESLDGGPIHAALWPSGGPPRELASLGDQAVARAINTAGTVVGWSYVGTSVTLATVWPAGGGAPRDLGSPPGASYCGAFGINDVGDVVGFCDGAVVDGAVLWKADGSPPRFIDTTGGQARSINNAGDIAGYVVDNGRRRAALWPADGSGPLELPLVLRQTESIAYAINSSRQIVGYTSASGPANAVLWELLPQQPQSITFTSSPPTAAIIGGMYTVSATGGGSANPVTFSSLTTLVCTASGATVSFISAGNCTIAADQAGNAQYLAAPQVTQTFAINSRPVADPGVSQNGNEGAPMTFNASGSSDPDGDVLTNYAWDFGDGTTANVTTAITQHTYADNNASGAPYVVKLTVTDARGAKSLTASVPILIGNVAPTAVFAPASSVPEGTFTLALTGVVDAPVDAASLQYSFDCGDGAGYRSSGSSPSFACPAADNGVRNVRAEVRDKDGAANQYAATVTLVNVAPTVTIVSAPPGKTATNYAIAFKFTDPGPADNPWRYDLDWGDGRRAAAPTSVNNQGELITESYRYNKPGTYMVTVRVTDKDGGSASTSVQVSIVK